MNSLLIRHSTKLAAIVIPTPRTFSTYCSCVRNYQPAFTCLSDNEVCKLIYNALIKRHPEQRYQINTSIWSSESLEIWWDILIKTIPKIPHNRPDIVVWRKNEKTCYIIDILYTVGREHSSSRKREGRPLYTIKSLINTYISTVHMK